MFGANSLVPTLCLIIQEAVNLGDGTIEANDGKAMVGGIEDKVLAHDSQANQAEISTGFILRGSTDVDAGEPRTTVSIPLLVNPGTLKIIPGQGMDREGG